MIAALNATTASINTEKQAEKDATIRKMKPSRNKIRFALHTYSFYHIFQ
jgi:hypothetical protein